MTLPASFDGGIEWVYAGYAVGIVLGLIAFAAIFTWNRRGGKP